MSSRSLSLSTASPLVLAGLFAAASLVGCGPRPVEAAPPVGYESAYDENPPPELLGAPEELDGADSHAQAEATDPYVDATPPPPESDVYADDDAGAGPPPAETVETGYAAAVESPVADDAEAAEVIGRPALPRSYARADRVPRIAELDVDEAPERREAGAEADTAAATDAGAIDPAPSSTLAETSASVSEAPGAIAPSASPALGGMSPIPNPPEPAIAETPSERALLGAPAVAQPQPRATPRAPAATQTRPSARSSSPRAQPAASITPVQTLTARLAQQVSTARLEGVQALQPGRAGEVTLRLPSTLAEALAPPGSDRRTRRNAANPRAIVTLAGEGYAVDPGGAQAAPLRIGEASTFTWRVTPERGAKGPLRASVSAEIGPAGSRERLSLGEVTGPKPAAAETRAERSAPAWVWLLLLFLAVALVGGVALLGTGRKARPGARPLNLGRA